MQIDEDLEIKLVRAEAELRSGTKKKQCFPALFDWLVTREFNNQTPANKADWEQALDSISGRLYEILISKGWIGKQQVSGFVVYSEYIHGEGVRALNARNREGAFRLPTHDEVRNFYWKHRALEWQARCMESRRENQVQLQSDQSLHRLSSHAQDCAGGQRLLAKVDAGGHESPADAPPRHQCVFRREQAIWTLTFKGSTVLVTDLLGIRYIAELLRRPHTEIEAATLAVLTPKNLGAPSANDDERVMRAITASMPGIPMTDVRAIKTVKLELAKRENELTAVPNADEATRNRLQFEISKLRAYLAQTEGRRGKPRKIGGVAQRSRSSVKHAIERAITSIAAQHPSLGSHLQDSIRTGTSLIYMPAEPPDWEF